MTGALSATDWNIFNSKIQLTSLSATGGISYDSGTGLFGDILVFTGGLIRADNTISIDMLDGSMFTGLLM
jgi:hypothetical protein